MINLLQRRPGWVRLLHALCPGRQQRQGEDGQNADARAADEGERRLRRQDEEVGRDIPGLFRTGATGRLRSVDVTLRIRMYRVGMVVGYWVGLTLILVFHHNSQQTSRFCQISICLGRTGQAVECQNTKSTKPGNQPPFPPCTYKWDVTLGPRK